VGVGGGIYPDKTNSNHADCYEGSHFSAYKNAFEGMWSFYTGKKLIYSDIIMVDNVRGVAMMMTGGDDAQAYMVMNDAQFWGETESPDCPSGGGFCTNYEKVGLKTSIASFNEESSILITSGSAYPHADASHG
jgi:hypothetical protein